MKPIRIRSIKNGAKTPWVYIQEEIKKKNALKENVVQTKTVLNESQSGAKTNQFGRFRYSELQYGIIQSSLGSNIEVSNQPIRIKTNKGQYIYMQQAIVDGACPAIRIRTKRKKHNGPWVYLQSKEV